MRKYLVYAFLGGYLYGFNFFISNFLLQWKPMVLVLPLAGIALFFMQTGLFRLILAGLASIRNPWQIANRTGRTCLGVYSYTLLIYHLLLGGINIVFLLPGLKPLLVYVNDYSKWFFYAWTLALMASKCYNPEQGGRSVPMVLLSFVSTQGVLTLVLFVVKENSAAFFR